MRGGLMILESIKLIKMIKEFPNPVADLEMVIKNGKGIVNGVETDVSLGDFMRSANKLHYSGENVIGVLDPDKGFLNVISKDNEESLIGEWIWKFPL